MFFNRLYYAIKPFLRRQTQISFRRYIAKRKQRLCSDIWPIDEKAGDRSKDWKKWPGGKQFAFILTHDVESLRGLAKCVSLMEIEKIMGFRSSFNFVPEDYDVPSELRALLETSGFEVGVHG